MNSIKLIESEVTVLSVYVYNSTVVEYRADLILQQWMKVIVSCFTSSSEIKAQPNTLDSGSIKIVSKR